GWATVAHGLGVVAGAVEIVAQFVDLLLVLRLGFGEGLFFSGEGGEVERASLDLGPGNDHGYGFLDGHVVDGPAGEVNGGGLAADYAARAAGVEAAAVRDGENFGDA